MKTIYFVSSNVNKIREAESILNIDNLKIIYKNIDLLEYQGESDYISESKCKAAADIIKGPVIIEDTSLCFNALHGLPGPYIKAFSEKLGSDGLFRLLNGFEDKSAIAVCTLALSMGSDSEVKLFHGKSKGEIVSPRGSSGFGWDSCFLPDGKEKTFAEMSSDEKNRISHRYKALMKLREYLLLLVKDN